MKVNLSKSNETRLKGISQEIEAVRKTDTFDMPESRENQGNSADSLKTSKSGIQYPIGHCMKCKTKVPVPNGEKTINARRAIILRGNCGICNAKIYTILPKLK